MEKLRITAGFLYLAGVLVLVEGVGMVLDLWQYSTGRKP